MSGNIDGAIDQFRTIKLDANNAEAYTGLGRAYIHKREYNDAIASLKTAIKLDSGNADNHHRLGQVLTKQQKNDQAIAEFQCIQLDPASRAIPSRPGRRPGTGRQSQ